MKKHPSFQDDLPVCFRAATSDEAPQIAQLVYLCGPNLLSLAFGPDHEETLRCLTLLAASPTTMFSFQFAHVAAAKDTGELAGLVIGMPYDQYVPSERRLAAITFKQKGLWRWLRLIPVAIELSACAEPLPADSYYISALSVRQPWRGKGIGAQLLDFSVHCAGQAGSKRIVLDVEMDNTAAQKLYARMGFSVVSELPAGRRMRQHRVIGLRRMEKVL